MTVIINFYLKQKKQRTIFNKAMSMNTIHVSDIVGVNAISMQSGSRLYEAISPEILASKSVELDFEGVELFASPFFNSSIGLLLKDVEITVLQDTLKIKNLSTVGHQLLNHVINNAIKFYASDSKKISAAVNPIHDDSEGDTHGADNKSK